MQHVNLLLDKWVGLSLTWFLSYFYANYYDIDIGVLCKLVKHCHGDRASLLSVFFKHFGSKFELHHKITYIG